VKKIIFAIVFILSPVVCFAQGNGSWDEVVIGTSFKTLAKAFVATADIQKIKKANIEKLEGMDEAKFRQRYVEAYAIVKDLPGDIKKEYGVTETMSRHQAIENMQVLDKPRMYALIDSMPNEAIARQFRQYLSQRQGSDEGRDLVTQVRSFWAKIKAKAGLRGRKDARD